MFLLLNLNAHHTLLFTLMMILVTLNIFFFSSFVLCSFCSNVPKEINVINENISTILVKH